MKYFFLLAVVFLASCWNKNSGKLGIIKTDSGIVNYQDGAFIKVVYGKWNIIWGRRFKDSLGLDAYIGMDTVLISLKLEDTRDTIRFKGKPLYDSINGKYAFVEKWTPLSTVQQMLITYSLTRFRQNPKQ